MYKKIYCFLQFIIFIQFCMCNDCLFSNFRGNTMFFQKYGHLHLLLPKSNNTIRIPNQQSITAYCGLKFDDFWADGVLYSGADEATIHCKDGQVSVDAFFTYRNHYSDVTTSSLTFLSCPAEETATYEYPIQGCSHSSYVHAEIVLGIPVVFAEICFDLGKMTTEFLHYVVADRSAILEVQSQYNPSWTTRIDYKGVEQRAIIFEMSDQERETQLKQLLGKLSEATDYESHSIIAKGIFSPFFEEPDYGLWTNTFWWMPLKLGSWSLYESLLINKSKEVDIDIYSGTSHRATFTSLGKCTSTEEIKFNINLREKPVPLYIWNYVRQRNHNDTIDLVMIGVNSPFIEISGIRSIAICEDICDTIEWLNQLNYTRHMPALGIMICCHPDSVKTLLDGFPKRTVSTVSPDELLEMRVINSNRTSLSTEEIRPTSFVDYDSERNWDNWSARDEEEEDDLRRK